MTVRQYTLTRLAAVLLPLFFAAGASGVTYNFQTVTYAGQDLYVLGIGNRGQMAGTWQNQDFIWDGAFTPLTGPPGFDGGSFWGINDSDVVVGQTSMYDEDTSESTNYGFTYNNGAYGVSDENISYQGINDAGDIVGWSTFGVGYSTGWASWLVNNIYDIDDGIDVQLTGVNSRRQFVGFYVGDDRHVHGLFKDPGSSEHLVLDDPQQITGTQPEAINDNGDIAGIYTDAAGLPHGFVRTANGVWTTVDYPNSKETAIYGINNSGTVVGNFTGFDSVTHSFMATPTAVLYGFGDVVTALRISGGLLNAQSYSGPNSLDINKDGRVSLNDAVRIARKTTGLEANP